MDPINLLFVCAEELRACRVCLATDSKLLDLQSNKLADVFADITGTPAIVPDGLPQHICIMCYAVLQKAAVFRTKSRATYDFLLDAHLLMPITMDYIRNLGTSHLKLPLTKTQIKTISIPDEDITEGLDDNLIKREILIDFELEDSKLADDLYEVDTDDLTNDIDYMKPNVVKVDVFKTEDPIDVAVNNKVDSKIDENSIIDEKEDKVKDYVKQCSQETDDSYKKLFYNFILDKYINETRSNKKNIVEVDVLDSDDEYFVKTDDNSIFIYNNSFESSNDFITNNTDPNKANFYNFIKDKYINKRNPQSKKIVHISRLRMRKLKENKKYKSKEEISRFAKTYNFEVILLSKDEQIMEVQSRKESHKYKKAQYKCEDCFRGFKSEVVFYNHMTVHDAASGSHVCEICRVRFQLRRQLLKHLLNHKMKFICKHCRRHFRNSSEAKQHYKCHAGVKYECEHCGKIFNKYASRVNHVRIQHGSAACDICHESFQGPVGLVAHKTKAHRDVFQCTMCNVLFDNVDALQRHAGASLGGCVAQSRPCTKCGDNFDREDQLNDHIMQSHTKLKTQPKAKKIANPKKRKKKCCPCIRNGENNLPQTLNNHDNNFPTNFNPNIENRQNGVYEMICPCSNSESCPCSNSGSCPCSNSGSCPCSNSGSCPCSNSESCPCPERSRSERKWSEEQRPKRIKVQQKFMCEMCAVATFTSEASLRYHQRIHTGERPHHCPVCDKTFRLKESLQRHTRIHTGDRPYKCSHCDKTFRSYAANYRHQLVHTKERRHRCSLCAKSFQTSTCVKTHVRSVHLRQPAPRARNRRRANAE